MDVHAPIEGSGHVTKPKMALSAADATAGALAGLDAGLLVMGVILQLAQKAALLQLLVKAFESLVDALVRMDVYLDHGDSLRGAIMTGPGPSLRPFEGLTQKPGPQSGG